MDCNVMKMTELPYVSETIFHSSNSPKLPIVCQQTIN